MANERVLEAIETGELILQVDNARGGSDPYNIAGPLRNLVQTRLTDAVQKYSIGMMAAGSEVGASERVREALDKLRSALRNGYHYIKGLPDEEITTADRMTAFESYGWERGLIGDLESPARVEALADQAMGAASGLAFGRYPFTIRNRIAQWLDVLESNQAIADGGDRQTLFDARDAAGELLHKTNSRVRFFYCQASDELDQTPELAKIGYQPRRDRGDAQPQPLPEAPGLATWDLAAHSLTIPALPAHATSLRAWRQVLGGEAELCGVSTTATVTVDGISPLTPGATYDVWVTGHNSRGDGPESNKTRFTA